MLSVEEARAKILAGVHPTAPETVALAEAHGRVLARPVVSRRTQPPADVSAMDGYALRAADGREGAHLRVIGTSPAGHPFAGSVGPGEAVRIFTGGFMPAGADSVLIQEDAERTGDDVLVKSAVTLGDWVRPMGLDFAEGREMIPAGTRLSARHVGLAAACNAPWVTVHRKPRIGILATGDEIALPGDPIPDGGIVSSNAHALAALVRASGGDPIVLPIAPDDQAAIAEAATAARVCDMLVTTGGASVGEHDLVQAALGPEGFELGFWKIAMRPGKPLIWGRLGHTPMLGLPGNPVSALVCATLFLVPALAVMAGLPARGPETQKAILGAPLKANDRRADFLRATLSTDSAGHAVATAFPQQDSSMMALLAQADALILRAPHAEALPAGAEVEVIRLDLAGL